MSVCLFLNFYFLIHNLFLQIADQRLLESELWTAHGVRVEFMTLKQIADHSRLGDGNALFVRPSCIPARKGEIDVVNMQAESTEEAIEERREEEREGEVLISVAYYRAGYSPDDYPSECEWGARAMIESSSATKCPTIGYQLAGTKKIQQVLCENGMLEKFISSASADMLRNCFAGFRLK